MLWTVQVVLQHLLLFKMAQIGVAVPVASAAFVDGVLQIGILAEPSASWLPLSLQPLSPLLSPRQLKLWSISILKPCYDFRWTLPWTSPVIKILFELDSEFWILWTQLVLQHSDVHSFVWFPVCFGLMIIMIMDTAVDISRRLSLQWALSTYKK